MALGLSVTSAPANSSSTSLPSATPSAAVPPSAAPSTTAAGAARGGGAGTCVDADALLRAYSAGQGGDARSVVVPASVRCAGPYATAKFDDPSLPDTLTVLFSVSPLHKLRSGTGPVCEVGAGEGGLPPITTAQGDALNCA